MISPAVNYHQDFVWPFVGVRGRVRLLIIVTEVPFSNQQLSSAFVQKNIGKSLLLSISTLRMATNKTEF